MRSILIGTTIKETFEERSRYKAVDGTWYGIYLLNRWVGVHFFNNRPERQKSCTVFLSFLPVAFASSPAAHLDSQMCPCNWNRMVRKSDFQKGNIARSFPENTESNTGEWWLLSKRLSCIYTTWTWWTGHTSLVQSASVPFSSSIMILHHWLSQWFYHHFASRKRNIRSNFFPGTFQ